MSNSIRCALGVHNLRVNGRLRNTCTRCKSVWYTDYFASCDYGSRGIVRHEVINRHGDELPEMKNWKRHEYDEPGFAEAEKERENECA
jgi:hypothetical protein